MTPHRQESDKKQTRKVIMKFHFFFFITLQTKMLVILIGHQQSVIDVGDCI